MDSRGGGGGGGGGGVAGGGGGGGGGGCKAFKYKNKSLYDFFLLFPFFGQCLISGSVLLI